MRSLTLRDTHLVLALVHNFLQQLEEPGKSDAWSRLGIDRDSGDRLSQDTLQTTQRGKNYNKANTPGSLSHVTGTHI